MPSLFWLLAAMYRVLLSWRQEWSSLWRKIAHGLLAGLVVGLFSGLHPLLTPLGAFGGAALTSMQYLHYWWRPAWILALAVVLVSWISGFHLLYVPLAAVLGAALPYGEWWRILWRFRRHTSKFKKSPGKHVVIFSSSELAGVVDIEKLLQSCEAAVTEFSETFGFRLKRRVFVFLFAQCADIRQVFGRPFGGFAMTGGEAVVLAPDSVGTLNEIFRHELTHLFSFRWNRAQLPFNHEGLATYLMKCVEDKPIDYYALVHVLADSYFPIVMQVPSRFFNTANKPNFYITAGSFTGFLIRTFGWETYRKFFCRANEGNYEAVFEKDFGMGMLAAERRWRFELLQGRKALEPKLSEAVAEHRVETAYNSWQFYRCLEEIELIARSGPLNAKCLRFGAAAHSFLGHYSDAVPLYEQLLEMDDQWVQKYRTRARISLGNLYDLLGRRKDALQSYQKALTEPDLWVPDEGSAHALVQTYMKQAFNEQQLMRRYKYWVR
jgi:Tetratricopeptide repeat